MRVVAYCRFSSEQQRDGYSIEAQKRAIEEYCSREKYTIVDYYVDEARSGTNDDREAFQKMITDSAHEKFQAVIVHKLDRFARDRYDSAVYKKKLKDNGVRLVSVLEPLDDSPESVIMESVLEGMSEYYSRNLSREVIKGKREGAKQAKHQGGFPPYGYTVDSEGYYKIVPEEAEIIKTVFEKANTGMSYSAIAREITSQGARNRNGNPFMSYTVSRMVTNSMYKGQYEFGRRSKTGTHIVIDDAVDPIVSVNLWDSVNKKSAVRVAKYKPNKRPSPHFKGDEYILTGYCYCAICSSHLYGFKSRSRYKTVKGDLKIYEAQFYRCSKKVKRQRIDGIVGGCDFKNIKKDELEVFVISAIEHFIFSDTNLQLIIDKIKTRLSERLNESTDVAGITKEINKIKHQQQRLLDLYLDGSLDIPTYNSRKDELEVSLKFHQDKLKKSNAISPDLVTFDLVRSRIDEFLSSVKADSPDYKKLLLATFIDRIELDNDDITIYFKFSLDGLNQDKSFVRSRTQVSTRAKPRTELSFQVKFPISSVFDLDYSNAVTSV